MSFLVVFQHLFGDARLLDCVIVGTMGCYDFVFELTHDADGNTYVFFVDRVKGLNLALVSRIGRGYMCCG